ncbi:MAG: PulJ/GspJ family protein [Candidatus Xenobia bacterium]
MSRGFTLVELVVSMFVFALLGTALVELVGPVLHIWQQSNDRADAQRTALAALTVITSQLQLTAPDTVSFPGTSDANGNFSAISFLSPVGTQGGVQYDRSVNMVKWEKFVTFYLQATTLLEQDQPIQESPPAALPIPIVPDFNPGPHDRVLARNITTLSFSATGGNSKVNPPRMDGAVHIAIQVAINGYTYAETTSVTPLQTL